MITSLPQGTNQDKPAGGNVSSTTITPSVVSSSLLLKFCPEGSFQISQKQINIHRAFSSLNFFLEEFTVWELAPGLPTGPACTRRLT